MTGADSCGCAHWFVFARCVAFFYVVAWTIALPFRISEGWRNRK